ncbi:MAG: AAA domain-containing protein, partial [Acidobacteria bacterium]|nr:AAA domain-containing protein [Acidobacteriota bacterium]
RRLEHHLELEKPDDLHESIREVVRGYNADDCLSTRSLRQWLEQRRTALLRLGQQIPRPVPSPGEAPKAVDERQQRVAGLVEELTRDVPADPQLRTPSQAALRLLADLLDWHRREDKADWWEFFRLKEAPEEDLFAEKSAVAGLKFVQRISLDGKLPVDRYWFEMQDVDIRAGETVHTKEARFGTVVSVDLANRTIDIKKTGKTAEFHASAVFAFDQVNAKALAESLYRLGTWVKTRGVDSSGPHRATRDLLLRRPPRLIGGETLALPGEKTLDAAKRIVGSLDHSVLAIQGPPGAGKTYTGARMICELVRRGKKVGVAAVSHRVIRKLLEETLSAAKKERLTGLTCLQKVNEKSESALPEGLTETDKNAVALAALEKGGHQVVAGTAWLWSREEFFESVDVLFVDEAGQMSLANVLAVAQAAKNIVLLGDPQQLDQPRKGSHPDGAEVSALEHILAGAKTIAKEKGLFLENTWRLHPKIRDFTSEVFYESRLQSRAGLENQKIEGHPLLTHSGLWFAPINHDGNQNSSPEEVNKIANIVESLLKPGVRWIDDSGRSRPLGLSDILIVAPYNAQVSDLGGRLKKALVGTVDKFQGQEAPVPSAHWLPRADPHCARESPFRMASQATSRSC